MRSKTWAGEAAVWGPAACRSVGSSNPAAAAPSEGVRRPAHSRLQPLHCPPRPYLSQHTVAISRQHARHLGQHQVQQLEHGADIAG